MKTLIVEDNATFRKTFKEVLCKKFPSMVVEEAMDGVEATEKVETFLPDLVFMDVRLPGETGLELTKKIRVSHPEIHIIILTDYNLPEYRKAAFDSSTCQSILPDAGILNICFTADHEIWLNINMLTLFLFTVAQSVSTVS